MIIDTTQLAMVKSLYDLAYFNELKLCFIMITYRIMCSYPWVLRPLISDIYPALALVTDLTCINISTGGCLILFLLPGHCKEKYINNTSFVVFKLNSCRARYIFYKIMSDHRE